MDIGEYGWVSFCIILVALVVSEVVLVWVITDIIANFFGINGLCWWLFAIIIYLLINLVLNILRRM